MARVPRASRWMWLIRTPLTVAVTTAVVLFVGFVALVALLPQLSNPFTERQIDRSQPVLLLSIQDLSRYEAAAGNFQVVIDLETDARFLPSWVRGERTLFVGAGSVNAYVDFSTIDSGAIQTAGEAAHITLPAPQLDRTNLDNEKSYVFAQERGLFNRIESLFSNDPGEQQDMYQLAEEKIQTAAKESGILERAEQNTRNMLVGMLRSLGYTQVTVTFEQPEQPEQQ
jgi:Protein of unknown function (DUF4230)